MIRFLLNETSLSTELSPGLPLLDFIRYHRNLTGTKIGCREGDCGACTVLIGTLAGNEVKYLSMTSCLLPLANVHGKHVVTIEGINLSSNEKDELNLIQSAMAEEGATQCGFCTPGFVVSLAGYCLSGKANADNAIAAIDGNICRCTGYKSIQRAAFALTRKLMERSEDDVIDFAVNEKILPGHFKNAGSILHSFRNGIAIQKPAEKKGIFVGGGTDLYVQKPEELIHAKTAFLADEPDLRAITKDRDRIILGGAVTVTDLRESPTFNEAFPEFHKYSRLVSSTQIRNMASIAGNFVNASPIGDLTVFFLALDAQLTLNDQSSGNRRMVPLRNFYKGYKKIDRNENEIIETIEFTIPGKNHFFHFEKVSKRTHLDIASVNTAMLMEIKKGNIISAGLAAGGVSPIPLFLAKTSELMKQRTVNRELMEETVSMARSEISPISDARGSAEYKSLLLVQLVKAHFLQFFEKNQQPF